MKKYFIVGLMSTMLFGAWGCKKLSEDTPLELIDQEIIFDKTDSLGVNAERFLNNIYAGLPNGYNRIGNNILDAGTDDALPNALGDVVQNFSNNGTGPSNVVDDVWAKNYANIRKTNIFLANIDIVPLNLKGYKDRWKAEARCLRAMSYFELIKRWGGVPLIGDKIFSADETIDVPRNTYQECVDYILNELNTAMPYLLTANSSTNGTFAANFYGRFGRGAAMALKSRLLLYAASPLNNPNNDLTKWATAATAAKAIMDSVSATKFTYALNTAATTIHYNATNLTALYPSTTLSTYTTNVNKFLSVFSTASNSEIILPYMASNNSTVESLNDPVGYTRASSSGKTNPTQELVNEYEMTNGKLITENGSGYDATKPYYNRDPRLPGTVMFDGLYWLNRNVQTYDGGLDRPFGYGRVTKGETRTGYYMRKFMTSNSSATSYSNYPHIFPIIRYAEILLNYAEAQNEAIGPDGDVYAAVNAIRARVGMPALTTGLTQAQMRDKIRHERRVEFAFEEHRFWDIRRWKIAGTVLNGTLHGIQGIKVGNTTTYTFVDAATTNFDVNKGYLFPIPQNEVFSNKSMVQNPNW
ncbi:RagB/SusD family nutrient uptake outer membrane protein [Pedobacter riviphilus]|uniref:RagB/SusD family nutrient uptake outer membrane protein n=1 Tax=Pedobacter riviphilus TaxID=2766984 RepID=A0ABX6TMB6_9SPHI|nr:RagB/SusD family nutrient uptake outer membrane protein [Pedobacter riviphilus]QNR86707.1 RagB/SusD family nutrient uptake outer membrane protein [Pedobacter riviphilus]